MYKYAEVKYESKQASADGFGKASCRGNDQPPEMRSCHTVMLGEIRTLKIVK